MSNIERFLEQRDRLDRIAMKCGGLHNRRGYAGTAGSSTEASGCN